MEHSRNLFAKRPHVDRSPLKFAFEVELHAVELRPHVQIDRLSVLWTRGSKAAKTSEVDVVGGRAVLGAKLSLLCTLFRDDKRGVFDRKSCTFTIVQRSGNKLGRVVLDLAQWASLEASLPATHTVEVLRGGIAVGVLSLDISSRWLKEYLRQAGAAAKDVSSLGSDGTALSDEDDCSSTAGSLAEPEPSDSESEQQPSPAERSPGAGGSAADLSSRAGSALQAELADERATRRELQAEIAANSLRRRGHERDERADRTLLELQALREQMAASEAQHAAAEERWHAELATSRREKESALAELRQVAAEREAMLENQLATVEETYGERLARAEEQRATVARRLGRTAKSSESVIAQLGAENSQLVESMEALENELCEALDARRRQTENVSKLTRRVGELEAVERQSSSHSSAGGTLAKADKTGELAEELSVAVSVRDSLRADIVSLEREQVGAKLVRAQDEEEKGHMRRHLRASRARQLALAERMTELEVLLSQAFDESATAEERIAEAFSGVIRELNSQLTVALGRGN
ncbi:hypothetical protein T492DRAFT_449340 [Pavlovales sp. CCMP2436]|nr:hypothetical protein T492DRAFT_449340 [Pavlovales sp. CCMP2436]|mmetsp:Transcript_33072/g.76298  ORF Transcript_33072/g.76298 Transcript_33072/m.76298 type:complete len:528 (+) Transcript_33072:117-1700(+)